MKEGIDMSQNLQPVDVTTDIEKFILSVESNITDSNYTMRLTDNSRKSRISSLDSLLISQNVSLQIVVNTYKSAQKIIRIKQIYMNCHGEAWRFFHKFYVNASLKYFQSWMKVLCFNRRSKVPSRKAGKHILMKFLGECNVACAQHQEAVLEKVISTVTNIIFNNQKKRKTERVVKDRVAAFKKCKSDK